MDLPVVRWPYCQLYALAFLYFHAHGIVAHCIVNGEQQGSRHKTAPVPGYAVFLFRTFSNCKRNSIVKESALTDCGRNCRLADYLLQGVATGKCLLVDDVYLLGYCDGLQWFAVAKSRCPDHAHVFWNDDILQDLATVEKGFVNHRQVAGDIGFFQTDASRKGFGHQGSDRFRYIDLIKRQAIFKSAFPYRGERGWQLNVSKFPTAAKGIPADVFQHGRDVDVSKTAAICKCSFIKKGQVLWQMNLLEFQTPVKDVWFQFTSIRNVNRLEVIAFVKTLLTEKLQGAGELYVNQRLAITKPKAFHFGDGISFPVDINHFRNHQTCPLESFFIGSYAYSCFILGDNLVDEVVLLVGMDW